MDPMGMKQKKRTGCLGHIGDENLPTDVGIV